MSMQLQLILGLVLLLGVNLTASMQITESDISFSSQLIETHLMLKKDSSIAADQGVIFSVSLSGTGAPSIQPEDVLIKNGGSIEVRPASDLDRKTFNRSLIVFVQTGAGQLSMSRRASSPSLIVLSTLVGLAGLILGPKLRSPLAGLFVLSSFLLLSTTISLQQFEPDWVLEVVATVPASYSLHSLNINIERGSVKTDADLGTVIDAFEADLCNGSDNEVQLDGITFTQSVTVCAGGNALLNNVALSQGSSVDVTSIAGSGTVLLASAFTGSFSSTANEGVAIASPCQAPTIIETSPQLVTGYCGGQQPRVTVVAQSDAVLAAAAAPINLQSAKRWSDPATWGGALPKDGDDVTIEQAQVIMLDTTTAALGQLVIRGTLVADPERDFVLTADSVHVYGTLSVGSLSAPYTRLGCFTLTGAKTTYTSRNPLLGFSNDGLSRTIRVYNGAKFELHGAPSIRPYTRLNDHAAAGATVLAVDSVSGWKVGDEIVISPTTFPATSQSDRRHIVAIDGAARTVTVDEGLSYARWGKLQYVTDQGLSLEPGVFEQLRAHPDVADVLDERAVVIHLTRNILITAPDDVHWAQGHGVHVMWMGLSTQVHLSGVEIRRAGQAGALGRYPLHAHMQSYNLPNGSTALSDGKYLGDVNVLVRNCAVHQSVNRAIVIHGTCGARYINNVAYDILGHAYFFEDGSELRNQFLGNVVLNVRSPAQENRLLRTDIPGDVSGSAGLWYSNAHNYLRDNIAGDIRDGPGIWNAFSRRPMPEYVDIAKPGAISFSITPRSGVMEEWKDRHAPIEEQWELTALSFSVWSVVGSISGVQPDATAFEVYDNDIIRFTLMGSAVVGAKLTFRVVASAGGCFGQSRNVDLHPYYTPTLHYFNNTAFACGGHGAVTDFFVTNELGDMESAKFISTNDSRPGPDYNNPRRIPTKFDRQRLWMNTKGAYSNRIHDPLYLRWICADNRGTDLRGATQVGKIAQSLFVGHSLNTLEPELYTKGRHAFATYHFSLDFHDLVLLNYPPLPTVGAFIERKLLEMPGAVESWDLYLYSIEMGPLKLSNWKQFNVTQFERTPPPNIEHIYPGNAGGPNVDRRYWTFSGAIYDSGGFLAGQPGDYIIFDYPFLTHGLTNRRRVGTPQSLTVATSDKFYGVNVGEVDSGEPDYDPVTFVRLDSNFQEVSRWVIEDGHNAAMLGNMRHASFLKGGYYRVFNHNNTTPNADIYKIIIANGNAAGDNFIVGMPWSSSVVPIVYFGRNALDPNTRRPYEGDFVLDMTKVLAPVNSLAALLSTPESYWRDTAANQLWYHHKGGYTTNDVMAVTIRPTI